MDDETPGTPHPDVPPTDPQRRSVLQAAAGLAAAGVGFAGGGWALESDASKPGNPALAQSRPEHVSAIALTVNGKKVELKVPDQRSLVLALREDLGLTGTKKACNVAQCGACTVLMDGEPVYSCFVLAKDAVGHEITTIEGLEKDGQLHPVQEGFIKKMGSQCGMCTTGMIMSGVALLNRNPSPTEDEVRFGISGVLCRCGNYPHEVAGIMYAAEKMKGKAPANLPPIPAAAGLLAPFPGAPKTLKATVSKAPGGDESYPRLDHQGAALDGYIKATGRALYAADFGFHPGAPFNGKDLVHAKVIRSPFAHAKVIDIDDSEARKLPGYRGMITWKDVPKPVKQRGILNQHARYCGDAVAVVAADDIYTAQAALDLVHVDWQRLKDYPDPEYNLKHKVDAIHQGGAVISPAYTPQSASKPTYTYSLGDVEKGLKDADYVVEGRYQTGNQCQVPIEPHCCTAVWDGDDLTLYDSQQSIFRARHMIAIKLGITRDQIRVVSENVGGGFGSKCTGIIEKTMYQCFAAVMARKIGRPVRYEYTLPELAFAEDTRNPFTADIKIGVKKDGTITASHYHVLNAAGGYASSSPTVLDLFGQHVLNGYNTPNYKFVGYSVYTNSPVGGEFRGFGGPQAQFCREMHLDKVADKIGMNPLDFRLKNLLKPGDNLVSDENHHASAGNFRGHDCLTLGAKAIGWDKWQHPSTKTGRVRRGLGVSTGSLNSGRNTSDGLVWIDATGKVHAPIGSGNFGALSHTGIAAVAAQALDMPLEQIDVYWGDTAKVTWTFVTDASRSCNCDGKSLYDACQDLIHQLRHAAAQSLGGNPDDFRVHDGVVEAKGGKKIEFARLVGTVPKRTAFKPYYESVDENPMLDNDSGTVEQHPPMVVHKSTASLARRIVGQGGVVGLGHYVFDPDIVAWGATFVELDVDMETGQVHLRRLASVMDIGRVLYRTGAEGQLYGGSIMGMGYGLHEALEIDPNENIPINGTYDGLGVFTSLDYPQIIPILVEGPSKSGPFGAKGLGENPLFGPAPAIGNAIYNASGVRVEQIPYHWHRMYQALKQSSKLMV